MDILISSNLERLLYYVSGCDNAYVASLMKDLKETFEPKIRALVKVPLSQNEYDAICSFAFNIGVGRGFPSSEFLKELNKGHYDGTLMLHWRRPSEIIGRRKKEVELFNHGVY